MPGDRAPHGRLFIHPGGSALLCEGLTTGLHTHFTASATLALSGSLRFRHRADAAWQEACAVIVPPNTPLALSGNGLVLSLQIDPESAEYARLAARLWPTEQPRVTLLEKPHVGAVREGVLAALARLSPGMGVWQVALEILGAPGPAERRLDARVLRVLDALKRSAPQAPVAAELAELARLSESRLGHLFVEQMGVPLGRYMAWLRVRQVVYSVAFGNDLTDAAHDAGFADSAHLTRVFRGMFGLPPSRYLRSPSLRLSLELPTQPLRGPHAHQDRDRLEAMVRHVRQQATPA
ncbi:MAG: AraC family transcriptional regulator [Myxococcales bacterium]